MSDTYEPPGYSQRQARSLFWRLVFRTVGCDSEGNEIEATTSLGIALLAQGIDIYTFSMENHKNIAAFLRAIADGIESDK